MGVRVREAKVAHKHLAPPTRNSWKKKQYTSPTHNGGGDDLGNGRSPRQGILNTGRG